MVRGVFRSWLLCFACKKACVRGRDAPDVQTADKLCAKCQRDKYLETRDLSLTRAFCGVLMCNSAFSRVAAIGVVLALFWLSGLCEAADVFRDPMYGFQKKSDITYGWGRTEGGRVALKLDVYLPVGRAVPRVKPAMVFMHGGGWSSGDKESGYETACEFARRGYVAVSINYRLRGDKPVISEGGIGGLLGELGENDFTRGVAAAAEDLIAAVRWIRDNAPVYGIDPWRIAIGGSSAGAITSVMVAHCCDDLGVTGLPEIAAVMNLWGGWPSYWGYSFDVRKYVEMGEPPCVSVHGTADRTVSVVQSTDYHERLNMLRIQNLLMLNEGAGHGWGENAIFTRIRDGRTEFQNIVDFFYNVMDLDRLDARRLDLDGDGLINFRDFAILTAKRYPQPCVSCEGGAPAADGRIYFEDFEALIANWLADS